ncbi:MAG: HAMP domain-containing protein, partial [Gallionella sp.]|nr:HAMP domain-containing protein [Gallionella sp.]
MVLTIKNKLILNAVIAAVAFAALAWLAISGMGHMGQLQDSGYHTTLNSGTASGHANMGARLYQVIADSVINRNLAESKKDWTEVKARSLEQIAEVEKFADTAEEKQLAEKAKVALLAYVDLYEKQMLPLLETTPKEKLTEAIREIDGKIDVQSAIVQESLEKVAVSMKAEAEKSDEEFDGARRNTINWFLGIAGGVIVILILMSIWIVIGITRPIRMAIEVSNQLADGDLTVKIDASAKDEIGQLLSAMKAMSTKLAQIITEVRGSADALSSASEQVSATAQSMSQATAEQAASVEETSASVEQMSASINQNTENAKVTDGMASQAAKQAVAGGEAVTQTVTAMKQIAGKIGIIDDIAYQTNLL